MTESDQKALGSILWDIANDLRGAMNADDFRDYMLSFLFLYYLSRRYEQVAKAELGDAYPAQCKDGWNGSPLVDFYDDNPDDIEPFETMMREKVHYVIEPQYLWSEIAELARTQSEDLLSELKDGFQHIEEKSFGKNFRGLFSEVHLDSDKLGRNYTERNNLLARVIQSINKGLVTFRSNGDTLGDAYEYLIGQFAAGSGKKAGEFYTPQQVSSILSRIVTLDPQDPQKGLRDQVGNILDFACGSGSLLLNIRHEAGADRIGRIFGQEKNITTYNLARMNLILHGVADVNFELYHGDTLKNDWSVFKTANVEPFGAVVANPPFSYKWEPEDTMAQDPRFRNFGLAPKSAADFAFLLHGLHYLSDTGVLAIVLPHGVLFRGGAEGKIRQKLLQDNLIDTVIGLPANLFFSTGIPVCILVLKKCKATKDVLFINASETFQKGKKQNLLLPKHIDQIIARYRDRAEQERFSRPVPLAEIEANDWNLNITRYVSTAQPEEEIDLEAVRQKLLQIDHEAREAKDRHNAFLAELGLGLLP